MICHIILNTLKNPFSNRRSFWSHSSSLHKVTPVTKGERLAAITWVQSMIADANLGKTLFELDQSIQALLAKQQADRAELDSLHHVYHNLIRQFAVV